jgi:hypothetical protein
MILVYSVKKIECTNLLGQKWIQTIVLYRDTKTGKVSQRTYSGDHTDNIIVEWADADTDKLNEDLPES